MLKIVRVLVVGDVVGDAGRKAVTELYPQIKEEFGIHFAIVNAENIAGGSGITPETLADLLSCGVDVVTGGDHQGKKRNEIGYIMHGDRLIRPANYVKDPGVGSMILSPVGHTDIKIGILNLLGNIFMEKLPPAFQTAEAEVEKLTLFTSIVIVDFHAEATSEKVAMGWFLDGQVSAVVGTHTHVQTADERVLPEGTAFITDIGMTGGRDGIIGRKKENVLLKFMHKAHSKFEVATDDIWLRGVVIDIDVETGKSVHIERVVRYLE